jgi:uncharacterized protein YukE
VTAAKEPTPLPPFSEDWVGGNIRGLSAFAGTLYGYVPKINNVATTLNEQVSELVGAAQWKGAAAKKFSTAWEKDSRAAVALESCADTVGGIVDQLAVNLARIESALEEAAAEARSRGAQIGANGAPTNAESPQEMGHFGPDGPGQGAANSYGIFYETSLDQAQQARTEAADALAKYCNSIVSAGGMTASDWDTTGDLLGDMIALPAANQDIVNKRILKIQKDEEEIEEEEKEGKLTEAEANARLAADEKKLAHDQAELAHDIEEDKELSKLLSTSVGDLGKNVKSLLTRLAGGAPAAGDTVDAIGADASVLDKLVDFGKDIPVIDVAAAAVGTGLATYSDVQSGQSIATALPEEAASNVAGVAAGSLVGGALMTAVGGGLVGGAVAAAGAGVVAFGVGDFTDKLLHQDWGADVHTYGVATGIEYGIGNSAVQTGQDFVGLGKDMGHEAEHIWDSF